jgi:hypothetical protein
MNQTFSFQRWSLLVAKHWAENRKRYILSITAMAGLLFMWFVFIMMTDDHDPMAYGIQQVTYYFPFFGVGAFYASQFFKEIHSRTKGINYLLLPASVFEKLLCGLFYTLLVFFVVYTLLFYVVDALAVATANAFHPSYTGDTANKAKLTNVFDLGNNEINPLAYYFMLIFIAVQSAALLGSAYFSSYSFIKTAIAFFLLFLFVFFIGNWFYDHLLPSGGFNANQGTYRFFHEGKSWQINLPAWIGYSLGFIFKYAFPPVFWATTYYRLKEKEV